MESLQMGTAKYYVSINIDVFYCKWSDNGSSWIYRIYIHDPESGKGRLTNFASHSWWVLTLVAVSLNFKGEKMWEEDA